MGKRQSIELEGIRHSAPIPMAAKVGNFLFSSPITGRDPKTYELPPDPESQAENIFKNIRTVLASAGGTTEDIAHMTVYLKDIAYREQVNKPWLEMFPDEHNRPARHAIVDDLRGGQLIQCEIIAVLG